MHLGLVVTDEAYLPQVNGLIDAAHARGWMVECFLTDTGVGLLASAEFTRRAAARPNSVSVCEHSIEHHAAGRFTAAHVADYVVIGGQYQDAELVRRADKVLVF